MRWYLIICFIVILMFSVSALPAQPFTFVCDGEICDEEDSGDYEILFNTGGAFWPYYTLLY